MTRRAMFLRPPASVDQGQPTRRSDGPHSRASQPAQRPRLLLGDRFPPGQRRRRHVQYYWTSILLSRSAMPIVHLALTISYADRPSCSRCHEPLMVNVIRAPSTGWTLRPPGSPLLLLIRFQRPEDITVEPKLEPMAAMSWAHSLREQAICRRRSRRGRERDPSPGGRLGGPVSGTRWSSARSFAPKVSRAGVGGDEGRESSSRAVEQSRRHVPGYLRRADADRAGSIIMSPTAPNDEPSHLR
jgi:hypothetical protein